MLHAGEAVAHTVEAVLTETESFTMGKSGDPLGGEDRYVVAEHFIGVLDGVTSRGRAVEEGLKLNGGTAGRFAATHLAAAIGELHPDVTAVDAVAQLSSGLSRAMQEQGLSDPEAWGWPAAASTAIYSAARSEVWRIGDAHVAINGVPLPGNPTPLDVPALGFRACVLEALIAAGARVEDLVLDDPTWEMLLPLLELQHHLRNHDESENRFAYGLIDGRPVPERFIQVHPVPRGCEIVLTTDGYISPAATLELAEAELASVLTNDPLLFRLHQGFKPLQPGTVSYDDRCYVRFLT